MMLKKYLLIYRVIFLIVLVSNIVACSAKEPSHSYKSLSSYIDKIYTYMQKRNFKALNEQYINPKYGFYIIYRLGVYDSIKKANKIDEKILQEFLPFFLPEKVKFPLKPKEWRKVSYSCEKEKWSNEGYFLQKLDKTKTITNILTTEKKYFKTKPHTLNVKFLESGLYHYTDTINNLDLYLKYIGGRWYILIWDTTVGNCDA